MDPRTSSTSSASTSGSTTLIQVINGYSSLWFYSDTGSQEALTFRNRVRQAGHRGGQPHPLLHPLVAQPGGRRGLAPAARARPRTAITASTSRTCGASSPITLDEKSEQIINIKDQNGIDAVTTLYSMLTNRLEFTLEVDGETRKLTRDELMSHAFSPRPSCAEAAYRELYRVYSQEAQRPRPDLRQRVRDWYDEHVGLRGYPSPIAVRNLDNDIPDSAVEVLLEVARENAASSSATSAEGRLARASTACAATTSTPRSPPPTARSSTPRRSAGARDLRRFHPRFAELARTGVRRGPPRQRDPQGQARRRLLLHRAAALHPLGAGQLRRPGARRGHPRPRARPRHPQHAGERRSNLTQHASLPLAETASVFGEMLMTDRLLREERDPLARRELLAAAVDDVYATVLRQAYFVLFEIEAHEASAPAARPTSCRRSTWGSCASSSATASRWRPEFRYEWLSIPHIYQTPFYCYAYSFGQLLVLALYRRFQEEGEAFKPGYLRMLSYGGSARPGADPRRGRDRHHRPLLLAGGLRPRARADRRAGSDEAVKRNRSPPPSCPSKRDERSYKERRR